MKTYKEFILEVSSYERRRAIRLKNKGAQSPEADSAVTVSLPGGGKSKKAKYLEQEHGARVGELDRARKELGVSPAHYDRELGARANAPLEGGAQEGRFGIKSDTNTSARAQQSSINTLKNFGYKNPVLIIPGGRSIEQNIRVSMRRNRKRPDSGVPGSGRVPQAVMNRMANAMRHSGIANRTTRREMRRNWKELNKKFRLTKPRLKRAGLIRGHSRFSRG